MTELYQEMLSTLRGVRMYLELPIYTSTPNTNRKAIAKLDAMIAKAESQLREETFLKRNTPKPPEAML